MARGITFKGSPLTVVGRMLKVGDRVPEFTVVSQDLKEVHLADSKGMTRVLTSFPSIDTPVCDLQVKEFNTRAAALAKGVTVIGVSMDLPFAQKRFCELNDIERVTVVSDYRYASFGINYGLLIKELRLLARAVLIVDKNDVLRYAQIVPELIEHPDYEQALKGLDEALKKPSKASEEPLSHCVPCEGGVKPMPERELLAMSARCPRWEIVEGRKLVREFTFRDFQDAKLFVDYISVIAEEQGHHPALLLTWGKVKITLTTHAAGGITTNDFVLARIIDGLSGE